ncbi:hypothetical protein PF005_g23938 [Phytophthora fragariae]|nr:hypothetical protein PF009_g7132 [Phytophthora fragariae]KAE9006288.1 hypothetical protein PF011_g11655 [Phytophthora fragariae]KAE9108790.1 hypothetical protein PF010_g11771 [Phytophthora fragariae]KAE9178777.1 hypothetical protein PF005_g23938 [Phytophthora fragariae]KAE9226438.1 hypothetical protein PF004_g11637 [Phytophthora fragariae]
MFTNPQGIYNKYSGKWDKPPGHKWNGKYWYEPLKAERKRTAAGENRSEQKKPASREEDAAGKSGCSWLQWQRVRHQAEKEKVESGCEAGHGTGEYDEGSTRGSPGSAVVTSDRVLSVRGHDALGVCLSKGAYLFWLSEDWALRQGLY